MGLFYHIATLPPTAMQGWDTSPFPIQTDRLLLFRARSKTWRAPDKQAAVKIITINHPRAINLDLDDIVANLVQDIVWTQQFVVKNRVHYNKQVGDYTADCTLMDIEVTADVAQPAQNVFASSFAVARRPWPTPLRDSILPKPFIQPPNPLEPLISRRLAILTMTWKSKCGIVLHDRCWNDHFYVGVATQNYKSLVIEDLPTKIEYD